MPPKDKTPNTTKRENPFGRALQRHKQSISESDTDDDQDHWTEHAVETNSNLDLSSGSNTQAGDEEWLHDETDEQVQNLEAASASIEQTAHEFGTPEEITPAHAASVHSEKISSTKKQVAVVSAIAALAVGGVYLYQNQSPKQENIIQIASDQNSNPETNQPTLPENSETQHAMQSAESLASQRLVAEYQAELTTAKELANVRESELQNAVEIASQLKLEAQSALESNVELQKKLDALQRQSSQQDSEISKLRNQAETQKTAFNKERDLAVEQTDALKKAQDQIFALTTELQAEKQRTAKQQVELDNAKHYSLTQEDQLLTLKDSAAKQTLEHEKSKTLTTELQNKLLENQTLIETRVAELTEARQLISSLQSDLQIENEGAIIHSVELRKKPPVSLPSF